MSVKNYIKHNILRVQEHKLNSIIHFYNKVCGMVYECKTVSNNDYPYCSDGKLHLFTYKHTDTQTNTHSPTSVCFVVEKTKFSVSYRNQGYWKIGLVLQDVNKAVKYLNKEGVSVGPGSQFVDVGFLTSLCDPQGHCIELLQDTFEGNFRERGEKGGPLDQPYLPTLGQITIRCADAEKTCKFYSEVLGMKLLCTEVPGNRYPFTLYFFAYTQETPPRADDLAAVENREWTYQRPYCQLEIQHRHNTSSDFAYVTGDEQGAGTLGHAGFALHVERELLQEIAGKCEGAHVLGKNLVYVEDPDGYLIQLSCD